MPCDGTSATPLDTERSGTVECWAASGLSDEPAAGGTQAKIELFDEELGAAVQRDWARAVAQVALVCNVRGLTS